MEWIEAEPLPEICADCQWDECYNCDHAGERWQLSEVDNLMVTRTLLIKQIGRLQQKVNAIEKLLRDQYGIP